MTPHVDPSTDDDIRASVQDVAALPGFDAAATAVLDHLSSTFGLALWMVTRTAGDDWVVLRATESSYGVLEGDVLRWPDSLCSRMVRGQGPRVSPRVADVEGYRDARVVRELAIGSYVGIPLTGPDGGLFGTLCGIGPQPSSEALTAAQPLFELQGRLLSSLLAVELRDVRQARAAELVRHAVEGEALDPGRWRALLDGEQRRTAPYATPASVIVLGLGGAVRGCADDGRAQQLLLELRRPGDAVARTGSTSYALLCPETLEAVAETIATDLVLRLQDAGLQSSCGVAGTDPRDRDLHAAWRRAEQRRACDHTAPGKLVTASS